MFCCVGLIGGSAVGQVLGGPWTVIAPAAGFAIGLVADMKFMKGMHKHGSGPDTGERSRADADPLRPMASDECKVQHQLQHIGKG